MQIHAQHLDTPGTCLPAAFAMAANVPIRELIDAIGHDGSEVWFPELQDPYCRRGFHPEEIMRTLLLKFKIASMEVHNYTVVESVDQCKREIIFNDPIETFQHLYPCVVTGDFDNKPHAVVWYGGTIYDTNGRTYYPGEVKFNVWNVYVIPGHLI